MHFRFSQFHYIIYLPSEIWDSYLIIYVIYLSIRKSWLIYLLIGSSSSSSNSRCQNKLNFPHWIPLAIELISSLLSDSTFLPYVLRPSLLSYVLVPYQRPWSFYMILSYNKTFCFCKMTITKNKTQLSFL